MEDTEKKTFDDFTDIAWALAVSTTMLRDNLIFYRLF